MGRAEPWEAQEARRLQTLMKGSDTIQTDANYRQVMAQKVDIFDVGPKDAAVH